MQSDWILVYAAKIPVRWRDLDDFGHVNNSVYFTYFEQARLEWLATKGVGLKNMKQGPVVVTCECSFLRPIFFPCQLLVKLYAGERGNSSFMLHYEIYDQENADVLYARGSTKGVWVDYHAGKSVSLPQGVVQLLTAPAA